MRSYSKYIVAASLLGVGVTSVGAFAGCSGADTSSPSAVGAVLQGSPKREVRSFVDRLGQTEYFTIEDDRGTGKPHFSGHPATDAQGITIQGGQTPPAGAWGADDLESAYGISRAYTTSRPVIAIIDSEDDPNAEADLAVYRAYYGLPACTTANGCFLKVNEYGVVGSYPTTAGTAYTLADGGQGDESAAEIALDIEMASATCPYCKIVLVEAASTLSPLNAWTTAIKLEGATYISNSFGWYENTESAAVWEGYEPFLNNPEVSFFASSGDYGYGVLWPATSAYVTAVGGTILSNAGGSWSQTTWPGSGAGCSAVIGKPTWQTETWCGNYRTVADVSAVAWTVALYDSWSLGGWSSIGGTSVATPLTAGIYAANGWQKPSSFSYSSPSSFTDVTTGNDCTDAGADAAAEHCAAGVGYDEPTGNGSPRGNAPDVFTASPSSLSVAQNGLAYSLLTMSGSWVVVDGANDATCTVSSNLPVGDAGAPAYCEGNYPNLTINVAPTLTTKTGPYSATVTATDATSQITHTLTIPISVGKCVPTTCPTNACGTIATTDGCGGGPVTCGSCGSNDTCSSNVCCPTGDVWDSVAGACVLECTPPTSLCPATNTCLTTLACNNATNPGCRKIGKIIECN